MFKIEYENRNELLDKSYMKLLNEYIPEFKYFKQITFLQLIEFTNNIDIYIPNDDEDDPRDIQRFTKQKEHARKVLVDRCYSSCYSEDYNHIFNEITYEFRNKLLDENIVQKLRKSRKELKNINDEDFTFNKLIEIVNDIPLPAISYEGDNDYFVPAPIQENLLYHQFKFSDLISQ
jgi:hypothetical protein